MSAALGKGDLEPKRLRWALAALPLPRARDGWIALAVDFSNWLRLDAETSGQRLYCHTYGRGRSKHQFIPGWPYPFVAALEAGPTFWTALLDVTRLTPSDDATAAHLRAVVTRQTVPDIGARASLASPSSPTPAATSHAWPTSWPIFPC